MGQCVWNGMLENEKPLDLNSFNSGIYIFHIEDMNRSIKVVF
nr:T9SS type A sorting domain-containing protein [Nonlabens ulvanivorans]